MPMSIADKAFTHSSVHTQTTLNSPMLAPAVLPTEGAPGSHWTSGWVFLIAGVDTVTKKEVPVVKHMEQKWRYILQIAIRSDSYWSVCTRIVCLRDTDNLYKAVKF